MSHCVKGNRIFKELDALERAVNATGVLEFVRGQLTHKWFGQYMNDSPLPAGFTAAELGKCEHAIRVKGNANAYEIGVVKSKTGEGYELLYDYWQDGYGLIPAIGGRNAALIKQRYDIELFTEEMAQQGMMVNEYVENGELKVEAYAL